MAPVHMVGPQSRIHIVSVELQLDDQLICVARCVGGVVRVGQIFAHEPSGEVGDGYFPLLTLERINRYGRSVEFFDAPHSAEIALSVVGSPVGLDADAILISVR